MELLERFRAKACPGPDPGWIPVRVKKTRQNKKLEPPFRFNRSGKALGSEEPPGFHRAVDVDPSDEPREMSRAEPFGSPRHEFQGRGDVTCADVQRNRA
jgi:hypothetical protein